MAAAFFHSVRIEKAQTTDLGQPLLEPLFASKYSTSVLLFQYVNRSDQQSLGAFGCAVSGDQRD